jgi:maltose 6'-phosphate phosphatase
MKITLLSICLMLLFSCGNKSVSKKEKTQEKLTELKVAAYNVEVSRNATAKEIGEKLKPYNFDVVCFSEAPGGIWTKEIGEVMGLNHVVVGKYSTAGHDDKYKTIASRTPLYGYEEILMADTLHTVTKALTKIDGREIGIYSVHFPFSWRDQAHIDETTGKVTAFINYLKEVKDDEVSVIMGDFNFIPTKAESVSLYYEMFVEIGIDNSWNDLGIDCTQLNTHNPFKPEDEGNGQVIDHIMFNTKSVKAVDGQIIEMEKPLSDHKPVWALLQIK